MPVRERKLQKGRRGAGREFKGSRGAMGTVFSPLGGTKDIDEKTRKDSQ